MRLEELLPFDTIVIQCHDNPDSDALASGYGVWRYLRAHGKSARFIYGGRRAVEKQSLLSMIRLLHIPVEYVTSLEEPDLLITVDCQPGQGNVQPFTGRAMAVIDHHQVSAPEALPPLQMIRSNYGSCSTIVWQMLQEAGYDIGSDQELATAFYYGLYVDTGQLQEISHPMDKDMRDSLRVSTGIITLLQNSNLSLEELGIVSRALEGCRYDSRYRFATTWTEPCDPNILGIISDLINEVDVVDVCVVYSVLPGGVKISVRSCVRETRADELAQYLAEGIGNGGGHRRKAGGFLNEKRLREENLLAGGKEEDSLGEVAGRLLTGRLAEYFAATTIVDAVSDPADLTGSRVYQKKRIRVGYVPAAEIFPEGTEVLIRMLEGDYEILLDKEIIIMIGVENEIYPIQKEIFLRQYEPLDEPYTFEGEYSPTVRDTLTGESKPLAPYARACVSRDMSLIYARKLDCRTKLFTQWDREKYTMGVEGDWLAARKENPKDAYIVKQDVFGKIYKSYEKADAADLR